MRSVATTLALMVPLHRASPEVACLYHAILTMAQVHAQVPEVVSTLWQFRNLNWKSHVGFSKLFLRQLDLNHWRWESPDTIRTSTHNLVVFSALTLAGDAGQLARHNLREHLRATWWAKWAPLRPCLDGAADAINRQLSMRPVQCMRKEDFQYGNDGTKGARYVRLLANTMWSGTRLKHAHKISNATCCFCGTVSSDENTLHALWECDQNLQDRIALSRQWHGLDEPFFF